MTTQQLNPPTVQVDPTPTYVCAVFPRHEQVVRASVRLRDHGISPEQLYVYQEPNEILDPTRPPHITQPVRGMKIGAVLGATIGLTLGVLLTGPLGFAGIGGVTGAAFGAGSGAMFGGLGGTLVGSDLPDETIQSMAEALEDGQTLLVVDVRDDKLLRPTRIIMERKGGDVIATI